MILVARQLVKREVLLAFRKKQEIINPLLFFIIVCTLFPLGVSPEASFLQQAGAGVIWVAALLSALLSNDSLFRSDYEDGVLEQLVLNSQPLFMIVFLKVATHWMVTALPLLFITPFLGLMLHLNGDQICALIVSLALGTPVITMIGAIGASLTLSLRAGNMIIGLLTLPLYIPILIFGTGSVLATGEGMDATAHFAAEAALLALSITLAPFAIAGGLRTSVTT